MLDTNTGTFSIDQTIWPRFRLQPSEWWIRGPPQTVWFGHMVHFKYTVMLVQSQGLHL